MTKSIERKFDEFFNKNNQQLEVIDTLIEYSKQYGNVDDFKEHIFCPECRLAKLTFVHTGKGFHLRTHKNAKHLDECYYHFEHIDTKSATEFFQSLNKEQVQSKLASMMRYLLSNKNDSTKNITIDLTQENPLLVEQKDKSNKQEATKKSLRRQKLSGYIDESIAGDLYIFYGDVKLSVKSCTSKNNFDYQKIIIKTKNKKGDWCYRASVYRVNIKDDIDENMIYKIVLIGTATFKTNDKGTGSFMEIKLENRNALLFKAINGND